jgi:PAS domain S-box-containing protein
MKYKTEDVINSISDFIIIVDDDRRIITTNKKLEEYIGINKLDLAGRIMCDVFTFYTNENKKSCPLIKALESDRSFNFNHKDYLFLLNGEKRLVEGSVGLIRANGSISGAIITFRDITDQVTTEAKLIENEKKFRKLYNSMVNSYTLRKVIYDDSGNPCDYLYLEVNDAFEKLVGKKRSEIIGKRYTELFPENQEFWINSYNHVTQLGESRVFEGYVPAVGKYLRTHVFMVTEDLNGFIAIDVTERKELELQLAKERRLFEELFTTLENAYALCEILGDEDNIDFKFIEVNPKFLKYVNKELEDIIDKKASELFTQTIKDDPTGTKKMLTAYYRAAKYGETQRFDIYSNLMERQIEVIAYGQGENRFAAEYIDISERKALQESLRAEKEKYAELFNSMNEGFVLLEKIFDENGEVRDLKISDINYAGEKILGKGLDEIFGKNASSFFDENCKDANASLAKLLEVSQRTYSKNDSIVKVNVKAFDKILEISTFNPSENMIAILFGDVTDQARLEEAIKHEREQLDLVFNTSLSAFALIEMIIDDNNKPIDYVFTKVNPQFLEVAKKEEDDIVGVRASKLYEVDVYRKDSMFHDYVKVFRTGEPISKEFYSLAYDAYLDISVIKIKDNTLAISFTDISEKKEMQDALHKNLAVLKQSQEIASIGSLELNIESNKILVSPEARRILGIQLDGNISFNTVYKLIHAAL